MHYLTKLSTSPIEPLKLSEMLLWLKQDSGPDDPLIAGLITAARLYAEGFQRSSLISEQWQLKMASFPWFPVLPGSAVAPELYLDLWELPGTVFNVNAGRFAIELPVGPLLSVDSFTYLDTTGTLQTLDTTGYQVVTADDAAPRLFPADGSYWPATAFDPAAVTITFTAGYAAGNLPKHTLVALKMMVADLYADRPGSQPIPPKVKMMLALDREFRF